MTSKTPRFEVVRGDDGYHVRFWGGSRIVWSTENYGRRSDAFAAIRTLTGSPVTAYRDTFEVTQHLPGDIQLLEVRVTDVRTKP